MPFSTAVRRVVVVWAGRELSPPLQSTILFLLRSPLSVFPLHTGVTSHALRSDPLFSTSPLPSHSQEETEVTSRAHHTHAIPFPLDGATEGSRSANKKREFGSPSPLPTSKQEAADLLDLASKQAMAALAPLLAAAAVAFLAAVAQAADPFAFFDWDVSYITASPLGVPQQVRP